MSSILEAMHETAKDLTAAGVMDVQTLREFDVLCLPEVEEYDAEHIRDKRESPC